MFLYHEKNILLQNIVGAECIVCTHWLNIVGAAALTAPMVPTPMVCSTLRSVNAGSEGLSRTLLFDHALRVGICSMNVPSTRNLSRMVTRHVRGSQSRIFDARRSLD